jgi:hypothetical protein
VRTPAARAALLAGMAVLAPPRPAMAWGRAAHDAVTSRAIDTLPKPLKAYYKEHRLELPSLSVEATPVDEGTERRFAIDRLLPFPFEELPKGESAFKARFGEDGVKIGRLPWLVQEAHGRLVEAFRSGDKARILQESDTLSALVADLHNPLALTDNADGQKTNQHGLWVRFSTRLPEAMEKRLKLDPDAARFLDDPRGYILAMIRASYIWVDNLLYEEDLARRGKSGYTEIYYEDFAARAGGLLRDRLSRAAEDVGSYWYTAWTEAGRPELLVK